MSQLVLIVSLEDVQGKISLKSEDVEGDVPIKSQLKSVKSAGALSIFILFLYPFTLKLLRFR